MALSDVTPSLHDLLEVENEPAILEFRCPDTGFLLWPLARTQFLRLLISKVYYRSGSLVGEAPAGRYRRAAAALPQVLRTNFGRYADLHGDILIVATGAGHFQREGRWFNRITDYLALEAPERTVALEGLSDWQLPEPRWNERVCYLLPWQGLIDLAGRLRLPSSRRDLARQMVEFVRMRAHQYLDLEIADAQAKWLSTLVAIKMSRLQAMASVYAQLLSHVRPRLIVLEQGCYSDLGVFNYVAREKGIHIAEPQHGMISAGHDAYCYAPALRKSAEYCRYLPHDFLGYGAWWNEQIDVPVNRCVVGHPHYLEQLGYLRDAPVDKTDILLLGDGIEFPLYLDMATELAARLGSRYRVVLRPHPLERREVFTAYPDGRAGNVLIDRRLDIYQAFASAYAVAAEVSTGLFEAVGLVDKILVWETPKARFSLPVHPFEGFGNADDLARKILDPEAARPTAEPEDIWASDWRKNYRCYLDRVLTAEKTG